MTLFTISDGHLRELQAATFCTTTTHGYILRLNLVNLEQRK